MVRERIENCFPLSLDMLQGRPPNGWFFVVEFPLSSSVTLEYQMSVKRLQDKLDVVLLTYGGVQLLRQSVTIDTRRRGGYRECLVCPDCDRRVRHLYTPRERPIDLFLCRTCHNLAYASQFRHRNVFERRMDRDAGPGRHGVRFREGSLDALFGAMGSADPLALDAFVRRRGRPRASLRPKRKRGRPKSKRTYKRRPNTKKILGPGEAYCVKCKDARPIANPILGTFKNGRPATTGTCAVCGTRLSRAARKAI